MIEFESGEQMSTEAERFIVETENFLREATRASLRGRVCTEVIRLDSLQREAVIMRFWQGLPVEEIAVRMRLTRKSVRKLLSMAFSRIKLRLAATGITGESFSV